MSKNLYLISQDVNNNYDTYDSAVVVAKNEEAAKNIHPNVYITEERGWRIDDWASRDNIQVKFIGVAAYDLELGTIVCSSYNAG